ncbi:class I SAM-dependent methyltransferase [Demequina mangrovi]|uniref:Methyltransferase domain-containing protein n=1 Tax=Demequina mangrovi TaxID=1043493 RepID=A0A1H6V0N0_9MICO|nr:class I SAM-dependent methyltransferase [Demequina mangrovi]SEI98108.1 hypothetical protein SAMN05421637_0631 [Demequina mangrovi]
MVHTAEGAALRFAKRDVRMNGAALDPSGLRVLRVAVDDESAVGRQDADAHPSPVSTPAFAEWSARLGTAAAMPNVYMPEAPRLSRPGAGPTVFTGAPVDALTRRYLTVARDAVALRARARLAQWLAVRSAIDVGRPVRWTSFGCGPAVALIAGAAEAREAGADPRVTFVDTCEDSLGVTRRLLAAHSVDAEQHRFLTRGEALASLDPPIETESQDFVEALDLLVERSGEAAAQALSHVFSLVRPGGAMVMSAMLADRPAADSGAAWPVAPRWSLDDVAALIRQAGIAVADAMAYLTDDGVYALIEIEKL